MFTTVFNDLMLLFVFLLIGFLLREIIKPLQKLFLPRFWAEQLRWCWGRSAWAFLRSQRALGRWQAR